MALKSTGCGSSLDDYSKPLFCLDIACELQNFPFETKAAIELLKMSKTKYKSLRVTILKLLNLEKKLDVNAVALKMGISNDKVILTASNIFEAYQKENHGDCDHPQYVSMSVFQACKLHKSKTNKKNFMVLSNLKPNQWSKLEKSWDSWVAPFAIEKENKNLKLPASIDINPHQPAEQKLKRKCEEPIIEDYDVWAKRTLEKAQAEIEAMEKN